MHTIVGRREGDRGLFRKTFSGLMLFLLLIGMSSLTVNVKLVKSEWTGTIYIRADGSIDPPTAPIQRDGNLYTFTADIYDSIVVERDNIVIDGAGCTIKGTRALSSIGILLYGRTNVTVRNAQIKDFWYGVWLYYSFNNSISRNNITANSYGVRLWHSSNNVISRNNITANECGICLCDSSNYNSISGNSITNNEYGIKLIWYSSNNVVSGNNITANNSFGIYLDSSSNNSVSGNTFTNDGLVVWGSYHNVVVDNTVNGKPLVYLEGMADYSVEDAGQVILVNCTRIRVENLNLSNTSVGIELWRSNNSIIYGNHITANSYFGLYLGFSSNNIISGNIIKNNSNGGIWLYSSFSNIIIGNNIIANSYGVHFIWYSSNNSVHGNNITNNSYGVQLSFSSNNNIISENNITNNSFGVLLWSSSNNSVSGNTFTNDGLVVWGSYHNVVVDNTVNGKPLVYLEGMADYSVEDAGQVILVNCTRIRVENLNLSNTSVGIELWRSNNSIIYGNHITNNTLGIDLDSSFWNIISGNNITNNEYGIYLSSSLNNIINANNITNNRYGIEFYRSFNNSISANNIISNEYGIYLELFSSYNSISGNNITNNECGVYLLVNSLSNIVSGNNITNNHVGVRLEDFSIDNCVSGNNIINNGCGVFLYDSPNNLFYHNNFINNIVQVHSEESVNLWDNGYPVGGNYWSDYTGVDYYSGPYQNITGNDGIGDTPYIIDSDNLDRYPLMNPWQVSDVAVTNVAVSKTIVGQGYTMNISVTVQNQGDYAEAFGVTVYANTTAITTQTVILTSGNSATITFTWNTFGFAKGNYTIWAYAWPVPGETGTEDNTLADGIVLVNVPGDVSGPTPGVPDYVVNMRDAVYIVLLFQAKPGSPKWNPNADINNDGVINMRDAVIAVLNFMKTFKDP